MPKESLQSILFRYTTGFYISHPLDEWVKGQAGIDNLKNLRQFKLPAVMVQTGLKESAKVKPYKATVFDFNTRYLTSDCTSCPFYVPDLIRDGNQFVDQLGKLKRDLRINLRRSHTTVPNDLSGLCLYSQDKIGQVIPKFLVVNKRRYEQRGKFSACNSTDRLERYTQRREKVPT